MPRMLRTPRVQPFDARRFRIAPEVSRRRLGGSRFDPIMDLEAEDFTTSAVT